MGVRAKRQTGGTRSGLLLFVPYALAVWATAYQGLRGSDVAGLTCAILLLGGAVAVVYVGFLRRAMPTLTFTWVAAGGLALLGLGLGTMSAGEGGVGIAAGLAVGAVVAAVGALNAKRRHRRPKTIFLSYRRADSGDITPRIRTRLAERFGEANVFMDVNSIELGGRFRELIADAVAQSDALIAVIGDGWLKANERGQRRIDAPDDLVRVEIETALRKPGYLVVPVAVKGASIPGADALPVTIRELSSRNGGVVRGGPDFEDDMARLIRGLEHGSITPWSRAPLPPVRWRRIAAMAVVLVLPLGGLALDLPARDIRALNAAALSPDGSRAVSVHGIGLGVRGRIRVWDAATGDVVRTVDAGGGPIWSVAWSPDGGSVAYGMHDGVLVVLDATTWSERARFTQHSGMLQQLAFSPDGAAIAAGDEHGTVRVWDVAPASLRFATAAHTDDADVVRWSPSGDMLASGGWDYAVAILDATTGEVLARHAAHTSHVTDVSWSADGRLLASGSLEAPYLLVWDVVAGTLEERPGPSSSMDAVAFAPAAPLLAAGSRDGAARVWDAAGVVAQTFDADVIGAPGVSWSPDGSRLAVTGDSDVTVWEVATGARVARWTAHADDYEIRVVGWSPDGRTLATSGGGDDAVKVWTADDGALRAQARVGTMRALRDRVF